MKLICFNFTRFFNKMNFNLSNIRYCFLGLFVFFSLSNFSQESKRKSFNDKDLNQLVWKNPDVISGVEVLNFQGCNYDFRTTKLPLLQLKLEFKSGLEPKLEIISTAPLTESEQKIIFNYKETVFDEFLFVNTLSSSRKEYSWEINLCPIRKTQNGFEKITSFRIQEIQSAQSKINFPSQLSSFASSSVLSVGDWYKVGIQRKGIYKIDKTFLTRLGLDVNSIDPRNIAVFGNGGKILPEKNSEFRFDDLIENSIYVQGENDGVFNDNDYIIFYANSTEQWQYNSASSNLKFQYRKNFYSDSTFYFITIKSSPGKRINIESAITASENLVSNTFDDYSFHEWDNQNLIKSGREKYGEFFDIVSSYYFNFSFPNLVAGDTTRLLVSVAGRNTSSNSTFVVNYGSDSLNIVCPITGSSYIDDIAKENSVFVRFLSQGGSDLGVSVRKATPSATGWLNYIRANARRQLIMTGPQMAFRDTRTLTPGGITKFQMSSTASIKLWDITDPFNIKEKSIFNSGGLIEFKAYTDTLREFLAFDQSSFFIPKLYGQIPNQNLHASAVVDYVIVTHPLFLSQARQLAEIHEQFDTLSYLITTPDEIYNEFSSGTPDPVAIRDFLRMLYERGGASNAPRYLLLFGDGSYDNKNRDVATNTNFIPTYQNSSSLSFISSITSDDFYGLLDQNEGDFSSGDLVDIGIGRWPVRNVSEAEVAVKKLRYYYGMNNDENDSRNTTYGDWRNWICFVADDADLGWETTFINGSENYANVAIAQDSTFNIDKIYADSYIQQSTPGGQRYPEVNSAINERVEKGALIINFSGHGGELGWAHESILDVNQILSWNNINKLHMMLTATCEFSRFDDPARTSAGEFVLLNPKGGAIGLFTTTRVAYASDADVLCPRFFQAALNRINGWYPRLGDVIRITKVNSGAGYRHFTLLGDPAIMLAYPKERIQTESINLSSVGVNDTIKALQKVTIKGFVSDLSGNKMTSFNGVVYPTVFDKKVQTQTLGNDLNSNGVIPFRLQKNVIYKGKSQVVNGDFEFTFIVPKDINYSYGFGKVSYYAQNGLLDATGHYSKVVIGGSDTSANVDVLGPDVKLFMNDNKFVSGGLTNENPKIYAEVFDSSGINTVGNGIGHDITAVLDGAITRPIVLNDYYETEINSYQSGKVIYQLKDLSEGTHKLSIKVWDVVNNSSSDETEFVVAKSAELALKHVLNYPNPFTTKTQFFVEHNQANEVIDLEIQVFTVSGKIIKTINRNINSVGFRTEGIEWDGRDEFGDKIGRGVYVYRVKAKNNSGKTAQIFEKLVILN